jgi:hypothetical protein
VTTEELTDLVGEFIVLRRGPGLRRPHVHKLIGPGVARWADIPPSCGSAEVRSPDLVWFPVINSFITGNRLGGREATCGDTGRRDTPTSVVITGTG